MKNLAESKNLVILTCSALLCPARVYGYSLGVLEDINLFICLDLYVLQISEGSTCRQQPSRINKTEYKNTESYSCVKTNQFISA